MGLASALSTALTGLSAAETTIDVVGNNLANSNTVGFKASQATFATQFLQTREFGFRPHDHQRRDKSAASRIGHDGRRHHAQFHPGYRRNQL